MDDKCPDKTKSLDTIGWREWVSLPSLGIPSIKAKIDTGARTSSLHAFSLQPYKEGDKDKIKFDIHPIQRDTSQVVTCFADIVDKRWVTDSGGRSEERYVIETPVIIGGKTWNIEITLAERDGMLFRMLLGRRAIRKQFLINPARSFLTKKKKA